VNDDVIKLREALFAAEPFLTYMLSEGEAPRNNEPLRKALTMVRGVLDMDAPKQEPKRKSVGIDGLLDGRIIVSCLEEHEDGSATVKLELDKEAAEMLLHIGFSTLVREMSEKLK
jgi:hypothetical protein